MRSLLVLLLVAIVLLLPTIVSAQDGITVTLPDDGGDSSAELAQDVLSLGFSIATYIIAGIAGGGLSLWMLANKLKSDPAAMTSAENIANKTVPKDTAEKLIDFAQKGQDLLKMAIEILDGKPAAEKTLPVSASGAPVSISITSDAPIPPITDTMLNPDDEGSPFQG